VISGVGRDLVTRAEGAAEVVSAATLDATIAFVEDRSVRSIAVWPPMPLDTLIGVRASGGFRKVLDDALEGTPAGADRTGSLAYQLLDEVPTAVLVSGFALAGAGLHPPRGTFSLDHNADICAGWARGGTILVEGEALGHVPGVTGPPAPSLDGPDPLAWHDMGPTPPHTMKRWRRIDVWSSTGEPAGGPVEGPVEVEAFFRDSHFDAGGQEIVVHEYTVRASLDPASLVFISCIADIGVLPWVECPAAAASASRLAGTPAQDLRSRIRETFVGTSTCTHLNDTLRALAAVPHLAEAIRSAH